jgi:predicted metal-dependent enzyme (double-stranded beta helix superfamily)
MVASLSEAALEGILATLTPDTITKTGTWARRGEHLAVVWGMWERYRCYEGEEGMADYAFAQFTHEVDALVRCHGQPDVLVGLIQPLLSRLLAGRDWLDERYRRPVPGKSYSQYLLYTPLDEAWSVVSFVWPGGATTPVHDHGTWGVIGVYQGRERETRYTVVEGSIAARRVRLVETASATLHPGEVGQVVPPDDLHCVSNDGQEVAVSVHVYGTNIGKHKRHVIDLTSGDVRDFVSGYDAA